MTLVAGVDSSTQSCKVVIRDAATGRRVRSGWAPHPNGTQLHPRAWCHALDAAVHAAGGLDDVAALSVSGQQHGMVCLGADGDAVHPALLWNDTRSADSATRLIAELGGRDAWAQAVGTVPVAALTVAKLRWLAVHEPSSARRTAAVCLPHDYLTWYMGDHRDLGGLRTDRGDASGTGYWSPASGAYRTDLLKLAFGRSPDVPTVLGPAESTGRTPAGTLLGAGTGDNMAAALGLGALPGDVVVSLGTSGTVCAPATRPTADATGQVAGFADAAGGYLPLVCTLNAARVLDATATLLSVDQAGLAQLALTAPPGANGLVVVPYLDGERTPDLPDATGAVHGLRSVTATPAHLARAAVEGMLCGIADGIDALTAQGIAAERVLLVGGAARSEAVRRIAPTVLGRPVVVPAPDEYTAAGAARQAAWALSGAPAQPDWAPADTVRYEADPIAHVRDRYTEARRHVLNRAI